ncbi:MAG: DUF2336 domain-containing protein [Caulobacterales bacterium]|jgi:uncharacterized protein (DUF2336 family)
MSTTRSALTQDDIRTLVKGATVAERAAAADKLCRAIDTAPLSDEDRDTAAEILRIMAADAAEMVRKSLAVTLKESPLVPRDVALKLARDVEGIALPMLNCSPVFTDEDLVEIVRLGGPMRQLAIARRPMLSTDVTEAIVEHGSERAVAAACANDNAEFAEAALQEVLVRFEAHERVLSAVAYRKVLPLSIAEKLVTLVGDQLRDHLTAHHGVSAELALTLAVGSAERATIDLVDEAGRSADVRGFVTYMMGEGRLSASLLLRALANGHMTFFEWGVAELAGVPHHRTWLMIHDAGPLGLRAIYERAGLPARLFPAFRAAVDTFHSMEFDGGARDLERFQQRMLQRFLTQPQAAAREDVDYLLDKMDQLSQAARAEIEQAQTA